MIIEDNDAHHHTHAEQHSVCVGETAAVLPAQMEQCQVKPSTKVMRQILFEMLAQHERT